MLVELELDTCWDQHPCSSMGGGSETGAQESPSMSDVELEYNIILPDKGKGKVVPDNTVHGG